MAKFHDYVPVNDKDFDQWFKNLSQYVNAKTSGQNPEWTHIPAGEVTLLVDSYAAWYTAYVPTLKPHTPAETLAKDEARAASEAVIRPFVGQWLMWKQVSAKEREEVGVHNKKPRRDQIPAPTTVPELEPRAGVPRQVLVDYRDKGAAGRGKPADVHGLELRWALLESPPKNVEDLGQSAFDTKSPLVLSFKEHERGKRIYMAGRWEIEREGIKGPFGDIISSIVP
ncbi:MAG: hypothetical protein LBI67_08215 [Treponema sp.]|jgi:hypothetical protein|nr:hypothetical protein [Treponema sp.]